MADKIIKLKIDVSKIDKEKLFRGEKGTYLDATLLYKEVPDQYGNCGMIVQDVSKADREVGLKGNILGNGKEITQRGQQSAPSQSRGGGLGDGLTDDDLPF